MADNWEMGAVEINGTDVAVAQFRHPSVGCSAEKSYNDMLKIRKYLLEK